MHAFNSKSSKKRPRLQLCTSIYEPQNEKRKAEIIDCLTTNANSGLFQSITIFGESERNVQMLNEVCHVTRFINLGRRPTFADWLRRDSDATNGDDTILVFANADISFPASFCSTIYLELAEKNTILCITRHEAAERGKPTLHPSPQWSQDVWCLRSSDAKTISSRQLEDLQIPIGVPRCDNRLAYIFWVYNWLLVNPCERIQVIHHHQSSIRTYSKKDASIIGAVAYVHPSKAMGEPSAIDIDIFTLSSRAPSLIGINTFLIDPTQSLPLAIKDSAKALTWQEPNITEGHAAEQLQLQHSELMANYIAFPWASWIDRRSRGLKVPMPSQANTSKQGNRLCATVCQHIWALQEIEVFRQIGITDLFWSHATIDCFFYQGVRIHPFPLYPVRCTSHAPTYPLPSSQERPLLYSFQGAYTPNLYLSAARQWIAELPDRPDSYIKLRSEWHFEQVVYREQVNGEPRDPVHAFALAQQADQYAKNLQRSRFALCPSGSGPNSIRLWEALGFGAIPVIISDSLRLPGDPDLWCKAALFIPETQAAIKGLPALLEHLSKDPGRLDSMQAAGQILWQKYGPENFVGDVVELLANPFKTLLRRSWQLLGQKGELLTAESPTDLPLQVQRWCRKAPPSGTLVIQIEDLTPLAMHELRWRGPLRLCQSLLAGHRWTVISHNPRLEALASRAE